MNIVNKVTIRHLKENKKRTLVTLLGTIISVAMIVAVATLSASFMNMLQKDSIASNGEWHVMYGELDQEQIKTIEADENTSALSLIQEVGFAHLEESQNTNRPYLYINEFNDTAFGQMQVQLVEGRLPENSNEIILSEEIAETANVAYEIGDVINVATGTRESHHGEFEMPPNSNVSLHVVEGEVAEFIEETDEVSYTVVGFMKSPILDYPWSAGYSAISYLSEETIASSNEILGYLTLNKVKRSIFDEYDEFSEQNDLSGLTFNHDLLRYHGFTVNDSMQATIFGMLGIIIAIIMVGSIALIFNAFAISVSERSRYLGMLSSVGATKRQKRNSVYFEGLIIGLMSIPIGILSGIAGIGVTLMVVGSLLEGIGFEGELTLTVSWFSILVSIAISALTIFISTYIPARRASKITAIDAIRQTHDVKLTKRKVRTLPFIRKIFGVEAEIALKNLKRNKKRYNITVLSLTVSLVLFLSVSYFTNSIERSYSMSSNTTNYDIVVNSSNYEGEMDELMGQINTLTDVTEYSLNRSFYASTFIPAEAATEEFVQFANENEGYKVGDQYSFSFTLTTVDEASFIDYVDKQGLSVRNFQDTTTKPVIVIDKATYEDAAAGKYVENELIHLNEGDSLDLSLDYWPLDADREVLSTVTVGALTTELPMGYYQHWTGTTTVIVSPIVFNELVKDFQASEQQFEEPAYQLFLTTDDPVATQEQLDALDATNTMGIHNLYESRQADESIQKILSIFIYGFITLITLISIANIFNTISTSISLRKREFAMLKSMGMTPKAFNKMIRFESIFYGMKATLFGLPLSIWLMYIIYSTNSNSFSYAFELPWLNIAIAILAVFIIVAAAMMYSMSKVKKENIIDALKQENV